MPGTCVSRSFFFLKNVCLDHKSKKLKTRKKRIFSKGLVLGFGQKLGNFLSCIAKRKRFYDFLVTKNAFLDHKNDKLKNSKIGFF